jgi:hypothetical protein
MEQPHGASSNLNKRKPKNPVKFNITLNEEQKQAKQQILATTVTLLKGAAGSGKTLLACQIALEKLFSKEAEKVIITRPTVSKEEIGFLPGDLADSRPKAISGYNFQATTRCNRRRSGARTKEPACTARDTIDPEADIKQRTKIGREPGKANPYNDGRHVSLCAQDMQGDCSCTGNVTYCKKQCLILDQRFRQRHEVHMPQSTRF